MSAADSSHQVTLMAGNRRVHTWDVHPTWVGMELTLVVPSDPSWRITIRPTAPAEPAPVIELFPLPDPAPTWPAPAEWSRWCDCPVVSTGHVCQLSHIVGGVYQRRWTGDRWERMSPGVGWVLARPFGGDRSGVR